MCVCVCVCVSVCVCVCVYVCVSAYSNIYIYIYIYIYICAQLAGIKIPYISRRAESLPKKGCPKYKNKI